jgi:hypothetical protein
MYLEKINQILKKYPSFEQLLLQIKCIQELPSIEMDDVHQRDYMYYSLLEKYFDKETQLVELITEEDDSYLDLETFLYKYSDKIDWAIKIYNEQDLRDGVRFYYIYTNDEYVENILKKYNNFNNCIYIYYNNDKQKQEIIDSVHLGEILEHLI